MKTNAARILERLGVPFELRSYEVGDEHLDASTVAQRIGLPPDQVFKTLVARGDRTGALFAVLPGSLELDLRALARLSGDRRVELVALAEVTPLTGYVRGGVTALGAKKDFPVFVEEAISIFDRIAVSAGQKGLQIVLTPSDYLRATHGCTGPIGR
ncbi:MAG: Cys-tRNA(Pro) deacylase [Deltaproteobacteria bacterium]|nr:Cys-tRNA(Pro) deacylase [Deltaproteobacteria bacterium]